VSKSKNNLTGLLNQVSRSKSGRKSSSPEINTTTKRLSASGAGDLRSLSSTARSPVGMQFGKAHHSSGTSSTAASDLTKLVNKTASSGLSSLLGGNGVLGGLFGLGTVGSLLGSLFGGKSSTAPAPPAGFALPQARTESFSRGVAGAKVSNGTSGIYTSTVAHGTGTPAGNVVSQDQIAQAVRVALLNSSSLNDVINEI
jgi:hypothetical protein